jgi:hypothetical protein
VDSFQSEQEHEDRTREVTSSFAAAHSTARCSFGMLRISSVSPSAGSFFLPRTRTPLLSTTSRVASSQSVNCLKQRQSIKNGFVAASASGTVQRLEILPVINDQVHKSILSTAAGKLSWSPDAISFMSNISGSGAEIIGIKTKTEKYLQENSAGAASSQIDIDTIVNSKPDIGQFYSTPVSANCDPHFHSCFKIEFHPQQE